MKDETYYLPASMHPRTHEGKRFWAGVCTVLVILIMSLLIS